MINYKPFNIPTSFKLVLLYNSYHFILIHNIKIMCILELPKQNYLNVYTKNIHLPQSFITFETQFSKLIQDMSVIKLILLKYKGKGFRLMKHFHKVNLLFNFAHIKYFIPRTVDTEKIAKTKIVLLTTNRYNLVNIGYSIRSVRFIDKYTKNGLRFKRQLIFRRKGKTLTV